MRKAGRQEIWVGRENCHTRSLEFVVGVEIFHRKAAKVAKGRRALLE